MGTTGKHALPARDCVLKVGEGRGFIVEYRVAVPYSVRRMLKKLRTGNLRVRKFTPDRVILTAAHCLPKLPPAHAFVPYWERTYKDLLGSLDGSKNSVCAECLFVDPVADIAVLGSPDQQEMYEEAEDYDLLVEDAPAVRIGKPRTGRGWVLTLDGHWAETPMRVFSDLHGSSLSIGPTKPGMSGSPILNDAGRAVGLVALGEETIDSKGERRQRDVQGPQPILARDLPGRFLE